MTGHLLHQPLTNPPQKQATHTQDPYADASIGNITGSNSVNVFLGLGLCLAVGSCIVVLGWDWQLFFVGF